MNVTRRYATIAADKAQDLGVPELRFMLAVVMPPSGILLRSLREISLNPRGQQSMPGHVISHVTGSAFSAQPSCELSHVICRPAAAPDGPDAAPVQQAGDGLPPPGPVRHLGQCCL